MLLPFRFNEISGIATIIIIHKAGTDDSTIWACDDRSKVAVESVLKLNGRNIRVRGSSFILSIKTKIDAVINVFFISGILTFINENIAISS